MTNPTTPFSWQMPTSTDLVTDLPADFETFGQAVATSMADLLGGTTGQVLSKASNTDMDFTWVAQDDSNAIQNAIVDAKGDIITATAADTPARLAVGTNGQTLVADSSTATGLKWATASSGGMTKIASASFSGATSTGTAFDNVFSSTYKNYYVVMSDLTSSTSGEGFRFQFRVAGPSTDTTGYYGNRVTDGTNSATSNASSFSLFTGYNEASSLTMLVAINSTPAQFSYTGMQRQSAASVVLGGCLNDGLGSDAAKGFILSSATYNISGFCAVYGLAQ